MGREEKKKVQRNCTSGFAKNAFCLFQIFFFIWCSECNPWNWYKTQLLLVIFALSFSHLSCLG